MRARKTLYVAIMVAVIVTMDLLFFRGHFWERLPANIGVVVIFVALWFLWVNRR